MLEITGVIEGILFQNDVNGYTVAKVSNSNELITVVGALPYVKEGEKLKLQGQWTIHEQFGQQFKIESFQEVLPNSISGIEKYLSSGIITGIGPVTAKKIVDAFKEDTLDILDNHIYRLSEIEGIGEKKVKAISEAYSKQRELKNVMVFLQGYGMTANQCFKVYKKYGNQSISKVKENPYIMIEDINGIGFKIADKIALSLGILKNSMFRIESGINYVANEFCHLGNTYIPMDNLIEQSKAWLDISTEEIQEGIYNSVLNQKLKIEGINGVECVFTLPYYYCELSVSNKLLDLATSEFESLDMDINKKIKEFEKKNHIKFADLQKEAISGAVLNGVEVITGGPGTGKTTIIKCIIQIFEEAGKKVFMAAPTGRAAKRMTEATLREAKTIHRLLELGFNEEGEWAFNRDDEMPLECDVIIVDEASMIDIILMNSLLKTISKGTRLIIVGDVDQLPSVGPGNVLKDIIESEGIKVIRLTDIFRQAKESMIIVNAHKINNGEIPLLNVKDKDFFMIKEENPNKIVDILMQLISTRLPKFNQNWDVKKHIQVLSPMRKGNLGVSNLNNKLQEIINPSEIYKTEKEFRNSIFRVGDKVMQTKNNYYLKWERISGIGEGEGLGVFNGDIGVIESIDEEEGTVSIVFEDEKRIVYDNIFLEEIDLSYATTIHKSQGSEFPVVIMPLFMGPQLLMNRNLLYTAITRAKQMVILVGSTRALEYMVNNNKSFERYSSLKWRIQELKESNTL